MVKCGCGGPECKFYIGVDPPYGLRVEWTKLEETRKVVHFILSPDNMVGLIRELRVELLRQAGFTGDPNE